MSILTLLLTIIICLYGHLRKFFYNKCYTIQYLGLLSLKKNHQILNPFQFQEFVNVNLILFCAIWCIKEPFKKHMYWILNYCQLLLDINLDVIFEIVYSVDGVKSLKCKMNTMSSIEYTLWSVEKSITYTVKSAL